MGEHQRNMSINVMWNPGLDLKNKQTKKSFSSGKIVKIQI